MHDLLHTSTSCLFKNSLKSHTSGTTAGRGPTVAFWGTVLFYAFAEGGTRDRSTTAYIFSGEAQGFGGLSVTSLLQLLDQCDLTDYDILLCPDREK